MTKNKVKKGKQFSYSNRFGNHTKFDWICAECGLVWGGREQARDCASRGHERQYLNHWGNVLKARRRVEL